MISDSKHQAFLYELSDLSRKYGIQIAGCGCCGSPYLEPLPQSTGRYTTEKHQREGDLWVALQWESE